MPTADEVALIDLMQEAFNAYNSGDRASFLATWDDEVDAVINEGAPFTWSGPRAVEHWLEDSDRQLANNGVQELKIELVAALKIRVAEDTASLLLKVRSNCVVNDKPMVIDGYQIVALIRTSRGWRQKAFAYSDES